MHFARITRILLSILIFTFVAKQPLGAQKIVSGNQPAQLDIRSAGDNSIRITLKPAGFKNAFPFSPALSTYTYGAPVISIKNLSGTLKRRVGNLWVEIRPNPVTIVITNSKGEQIQQFTFSKEGQLVFKLDDQPVLGMGEGGSKPDRNSNWHNKNVEFDRRGLYDSMQPRWQSDAYGSRNPVAMLAGTAGWGIFVVSPWVQIDLRDKEKGIFIPWHPTVQQVQDQKNQQQQAGKGLPPKDSLTEGLFDFFVFDAHRPEAMMKDLSVITGSAVMPPKWALGYMQSHRTLEDENQLIAIADSFREKHIPIDAVIYLGTGFTPKGWNTLQPSFDFNPAVFKRDPALFISDMHKHNLRVVLHIVPWDRDKLPLLHGSIPVHATDKMDAGHIANYWHQHLDLLNKGVDGFWPDEGDWFDLFERMKRHQMYYQGPVSTNHLRPWSLHRNGYLGVAKWGGWVWSGDTESSWKTLEAQIAVGINHSISLSPYWGSDIGGFYSNEELTGELYARWFQFGAFCPSFRSHGRTWWTRLPWGWGLNDMGPHEQEHVPLQSEMGNRTIEPICKMYDELRYQLLPYNYTLAWEARSQGLPFMRALWIHYPDDSIAKHTGNEYLWGKDMLVAPVYIKGASSREVYLPKGDWYDWWTNEKITGGVKISKNVDLSIMPIYVKAGAIIPFDPIRQYTSQEVHEPMTIKIFRGANGRFVLYEDDDSSLNYLKGNYTTTAFSWNDRQGTLTISPTVTSSSANRKFKIEIYPGKTSMEINYYGKKIVIDKL